MTKRRRVDETPRTASWLDPIIVDLAVFLTYATPNMLFAFTFTVKMYFLTSADKFTDGTQQLNGSRHPRHHFHSDTAYSIDFVMQLIHSASVVVIIAVPAVPAVLIFSSVVNGTSCVIYETSFVKYRFYIGLAWYELRKERISIYYSI